MEDAPTKAARAALVYAFNQLGKPTLCMSEPDWYTKRLDGTAFDASSLIYHAYVYAGIDTGGIGSSRNIIPWGGATRGSWIRKLPASAKAKPGDINGYLLGGPASGFVNLSVGGNLVIQSTVCGGVVHITNKTAPAKYHVGVYRAVPGNIKNR